MNQNELNQEFMQIHLRQKAAWKIIADGDDEVT